MSCAQLCDACSVTTGRYWSPNSLYFSLENMEWWAVPRSAHDGVKSGFHLPILILSAQWQATEKNMSWHALSGHKAASKHKCMQHANIL